MRNAKGAKTSGISCLVRNCTAPHKAHQRGATLLAARAASSETTNRYQHRLHRGTAERPAAVSGSAAHGSCLVATVLAGSTRSCPQLHIYGLRAIDMYGG